MKPLSILPKESAFGFIAAMDEFQRSLVFHSKVGAKVFQASRLSANCEIDVPSRITRLLPWCSPTHIARFVSEVVINAVHTQPLWALAYIFKKALKLQPPLANRNATTTIVLKPWVLRVRAALDYLTPYLVSTGLFLSKTSALPVPKASQCGKFSLKTATRSGLANLEKMIFYGLLVPAIAKAKADSVPIMVGWQIGKYQKSSKSGSDEGLSLRHSNGLSLLCLAVGRWMQPPPDCGNAIAVLPSASTLNFGGYGA